MGCFAPWELTKKADMEVDGRGEVGKEEGMIEEGGRRRKGGGRSRGRIVGERRQIKGKDCRGGREEKNGWSGRKGRG